MNNEVLFNKHVSEYEEWFDRYPFVFRSEVEILREMLPEGDKLTGIEVGVGTGRFAEQLGIKQGVDFSEKMRALAIKRGVEIMDAKAEHLPYGDNRFDFVLMNFCISYFDELHRAFKEANRVLKQSGSLIVSFIEKSSLIGEAYERNKDESTFYKNATFYGTEKVLDELKNANFRNMEIRQTLFNELENIREVQPSKPGYGEGSFVVIRAFKKN